MARAYRISSSPPTVTVKPPSACFMRPRKCHLKLYVSVEFIMVIIGYRHSFAVRQVVGLFSAENDQSDYGGV